MHITCYQTRTHTHWFCTGECNIFSSTGTEYIQNIYRLSLSPLSSAPISRRRRKFAGNGQRRRRWQWWNTRLWLWPGFVVLLGLYKVGMRIKVDFIVVVAVAVVRGDARSKPNEILIPKRAGQLLRRVFQFIHNYLFIKTKKI